MGVGEPDLYAGIAPAPTGSRIAVIDFLPGSLNVALLIVAADGSLQMVGSRGLPPVSAVDLTEAGLPNVVSAAVEVLRAAGIGSPDDIRTLYLSGDAAHNPLVQRAFRPLCADQRVRPSRPYSVAAPRVAMGGSPRDVRVRRVLVGVGSAVVVLVLVVVSALILSRGSSGSSGPNYASVEVGAELGEKQAVVDAAAGRLYVANDMSKTVAVVDIANRSVVTKISFPDELVGIAIDPELQRLYVATRGDAENATPRLRATLSMVDTTSNSVVASLETGPGSRGVAVDPGSHLVYVTNEKFLGFQQDPDVVNVNATATLSVIEPRSARLLSSIELGTSAGEVAIDPTGRTAYVAGSRYNSKQNDVGVIVVDLASSRVAGMIGVPGNGMPRMAVDFAAGIAVLVGNDNIYLADLETRALVCTLRAASASGSVAVDSARHVGYAVDNGRSGYQLLGIDITGRALGAAIGTGGKMLVGSAVDPESHAIYALVGGAVVFIPPPQ